MNKTNDRFSRWMFLISVFASLEDIGYWENARFFFAEICAVWVGLFTNFCSALTHIFSTNAYTYIVFVMHKHGIVVGYERKLRYKMPLIYILQESNLSILCCINTQFTLAERLFRLGDSINGSTPLWSRNLRPDLDFLIRWRIHEAHHNGQSDEYGMFFLPDSME